jgi:hypothetical protein
MHSHTQSLPRITAIAVVWSQPAEFWSHGSFVGIFVGDPVGAFVGDLVGTTVGIAVGDTVGTVVGLFLFLNVGALVGAFVGDAVGVDVGIAVGASVGAAVGKSVDMQLVELDASATKPSMHSHTQSLPRITAIAVSWSQPIGFWSHGICVGMWVGDFVGALVGMCVGESVGALVGALVGPLVGAGVAHIFPAEHTSLIQSLATRHDLPMPHGEHSTPPQSISVSSVSFTPSRQAVIEGATVGAAVGVTEGLADAVQLFLLVASREKPSRHLHTQRTFFLPFKVGYVLAVSQFVSAFEAHSSSVGGGFFVGDDVGAIVGSFVGAFVGSLHQSIRNRVWGSGAFAFRKGGVAARLERSFFPQAQNSLVWDLHQSSDDSGADRCCICQEKEFHDGDVVWGPSQCAHRFCPGCAIDAVTHNSHCPLCRAQVSLPVPWVVGLIVWRSMAQTAVALTRKLAMVSVAASASRALGYWPKRTEIFGDMMSGAWYAALFFFAFYIFVAQCLNWGERAFGISLHGALRGETWTADSRPDYRKFPLVNHAFFRELLESHQMRLELPQDDDEGHQLSQGEMDRAVFANVAMSLISQETPRGAGVRELSLADDEGFVTSCRVDLAEGEDDEREVVAFCAHYGEGMLLMWARCPKMWRGRSGEGRMEELSEQELQKYRDNGDVDAVTDKQHRLRNGINTQREWRTFFDMANIALFALIAVDSASVFERLLVYGWTAAWNGGDPDFRLGRCAEGEDRSGSGGSTLWMTVLWVAMLAAFSSPGSATSETSD